MTEPLRYEVPGETFVDRTRRARALNDELTSGKTIDVAEWSGRMRALLREVEPLPLVIGVRYRAVIFGGALTMEHRHFEDETGAIHGLDVPSPAGLSMVEVEGVYRGRHPAGPWQGLIALDLTGGKVTAISDIDVLRCEEVRP
jgi:hypothetical protein